MIRALFTHVLEILSELLNDRHTYLAIAHGTHFYSFYPKVASGHSFVQITCNNIHSWFELNVKLIIYDFISFGTERIEKTQFDVYQFFSSRLLLS